MIDWKKGLELLNEKALEKPLIFRSSGARTLKTQGMSLVVVIS